MSKVSCLTLHVYCENSVFLMAWEGVERFLFREGEITLFSRWAEGGSVDANRMQGGREGGAIES